MFSSASWRKNWNVWSFDEPCRWHLWLRTEGFERLSKQGTGFPCPESYKIPICALCHFVPFWLPPQARKNFRGNSIIKQQAFGLNVPGGVFIPPFCDPLLPNFSTPWAAALQSSPFLSTWFVFLSDWEWYTLRGFAFYPLLYFKACFSLSPDTGNPLWFFLDFKGLMVQHRTWIFGDIFQPPLTPASEKFREQPLRRAKVVPMVKCSREVFVFKIKWIY